MASLQQWPLTKTPTSRDQAVFVLTAATTMTELITLPLVHARGVKTRAL